MHRHPIHRTRTTVGSVIQLGSALAPLVIHELVKDPDKRWRYIRLAAAVTAVASATLWRDRVKGERERAADELAV